MIYEDYSVEKKVLLGPGEDLAVYLTFYYGFFSYCGFPFLPNWIEGTLLGYLFPDTMDKTSLSKILPSGPVP